MLEKNKLIILLFHILEVNMFFLSRKCRYIFSKIWQEKIVINYMRKEFTAQVPVFPYITKLSLSNVACLEFGCVVRISNGSTPSATHLLLFWKGGSF